MSDRRRAILLELERVSTRVARLLAGQDATLADLPLPQEAEPGETPLERLQRYRRQLQEALDRLRRGEPACCAKCGRELGATELDAVPWASVCRACA